jgi:RecA/RadA recombinase
MSDLLNKLRKNTTIKDSDILSDSKFFNAKDMIRTTVPAINIALSGKINGGFVPGLTIWAGPSKHFKTSFSLLMAKAYMDTYSDAVMLFYDSEFGTPQSYFDSFGIDTSRVLHTPITDVEQLKFDIMHQFEEIKRGDHVIIVIDSVGNLASKKEVEDALKQNSAADMTRAKQLKSLFRMVTPHLNLKDIPLVVVNHTYQTQEMYSKAVVSGGCMVGGTKIQTICGLKEIQDVTVGEIVHTLDGEKMITHTWTPETLEFGEPECYEIQFEDGHVVTVSNQHPFLTSNGWVDAEDLVEGTEVLKI